MDEYVPPVRRWRWWVITATVVVLAGAAVHLAFARAIAQRVAGGVPVAAEVTGVRSLPLGKTYRPQRVTVAYHWGGPRSARLASALDDGDHRVGDRLTLLVDPGDPDRVATATGFASEGSWLLVPPAATFYGLLALLVVAVRRGRWWWRHERRAPTHVPLLTVTGSIEDAAVVPWEWVKEARRLAAVAEEASKGRTSPLRLLILIRIGGRGGPRVAWYSRRSRRLVVVGSIAPGALGHPPPDRLAGTVSDCARVAARWASRRRPGTDLSGLTEALVGLRGPAG